MFEQGFLAARTLPQAAIVLMAGGGNAAIIFDQLIEWTSIQAQTIPLFRDGSDIYVVTNYDDWRRRIGLSARAIQTALNRLKERDLVKIQYRYEGRAQRLLVGVNWPVFTAYCGRALEIDYGSDNYDEAVVEGYILSGHLDDAVIAAVYKPEVTDLTLAAVSADDAVTAHETVSGHDVSSPFVPLPSPPQTPSLSSPYNPPTSYAPDALFAADDGATGSPAAPQQGKRVFGGAVRAAASKTQADLRRKARTAGNAHAKQVTVTVYEALAAAGTPADDGVEVAEEGERMITKPSELESLLVGVLRQGRGYTMKGARLSDVGRRLLSANIVLNGETFPSPEDFWCDEPLYREWLDRDALLWFRERALPTHTNYTQAERHLIQLVSKIKNGGHGFYEYKERVEGERRAAEIAEQERRRNYENYAAMLSHAPTAAPQPEVEISDEEYRKWLNED